MTSEFKKLLLIIVIVLVTGMLLHVLIPHDHPAEIFGTGIQAVLHGTDKKWWLLILLASFLLAIGSSIKKTQSDDRQISLPHSFWLTFNFSKIRDPLREAFRRGIIHPKLCG